MAGYYLTFDAGTQSVKVAVYDENRQCLVSVAHPTTLSYPQPGWVEMNVDEYFQLTKQGIKECSEQLQAQGLNPQDIKIIMGDGIICGIAGIDATGQPVTPYINYLDSRTKEDAAELCATPRAIWGAETGNAEPLCMFPAMFARWFLKNVPEFAQRGAKLVHNAPYILMHLAGLSAAEAFVDWGAMSGWGLGYNVMKKEWSQEQLDILGIARSYMPEIKKPWEIVGGLTKELAELTGLKEGTPICAGAGDTMQSMLGCGIFEAGRAVDVAGTCAMFCVSTTGIVPELTKPGSGLIFNSGTLENTYFYWGFVRTGGLALRWFKDNICRQSESNSYYEVLNKQAESVPAGCEGVIFLPYLTGGYAESSIKGCFLNMSMATDQATLWRAVLEGIAYDYQDITTTYRQAGIPINTITITEGGSHDLLWNQIKADVLASNVVTYKTAGGALLMNALVGALALGEITELKEALGHELQPLAVFKPLAENKAVYQQQMEQRSLFLRGLQTK